MIRFFHLSHWNRLRKVANYRATDAFPIDALFIGPSRMNLRKAIHRSLGNIWMFLFLKDTNSTISKLILSIQFTNIPRDFRQSNMNFSETDDFSFDTKCTVWRQIYSFESSNLLNQIWIVSPENCQTQFHCPRGISIPAHCTALSIALDPNFEESNPSIFEGCLVLCYFRMEKLDIVWIYISLNFSVSLSKSDLISEVYLHQKWIFQKDRSSQMRVRTRVAHIRKINFVDSWESEKVLSFITTKSIWSGFEVDRRRNSRIWIHSFFRPPFTSLCSEIVSISL